MSNYTEPVRQYHQKLTAIVGSLPVRAPAYMYEAGIPADTSEGICGHNIEAFKTLLHNGVLNPSDARIALELHKKYPDLGLERIVAHVHIAKYLYELFSALENIDSVILKNIIAQLPQNSGERKNISPAEAPFRLYVGNAAAIIVSARQQASPFEVASFSYLGSGSQPLGWVYLTPQALFVRDADERHHEDYRLENIADERAALAELLGV
jgi:hypothetical protein